MKQSTTSERLKDIMVRRKLRQVDILELAKPYCERFGVKLGKNDLSQYVSGKVEPGQEKLTILGLALNVNEAWLMGYDVPIVRGSFTTCPVCGMQYVETVKSDIKEHDRYHKLFCGAAEYYGYDVCYPLSKLGGVKSEAYNILYSNASFQEKYNGALELLKAYFSRSLSANNYQLDHPKFDEYLSMLLYQKQFHNRFGDEIYSALVKKYGKKPGIPEGETTYRIQEIIDPILETPKPDKAKTVRFPQKQDEADDIANRYRKLDDHGKGAVKAILNFEEASFVAASRQNGKPAKPRSDGFVEIKVFDQPAAAGLGNYLDDPSFHIEQYPANEVPEGTEFGIRISGNSMAPNIPDGATVFVQSRSSIEPGKIGIFLLNEESYCKKLAVDRIKREVRLVSFNKDYKDRIIEDADVFSTMALVLGWWPKG